MGNALPSGVAVDFGGTKISAARVDHGRIDRTVTVRTDGKADATAQVDAICALLDDLELQPEEQVGVAVAGRINRDGVWYVVNTETLKGVTEVPVQALLSDRLQRQVIVENDATAAAIGEYVAGAGQGVGAFGFITVSTGVGGGFVLGGRPLISDSGLAGHVGFTTSRVASARCGSGRRQTGESIASGRAISALAAMAGYPSMDAKSVFEAHLAGAAWASALIQQSASAVAELCANLKAVLDIDRIALGGSIGLAQGYLDLVQHALVEEPPIFRPEIRHAALGADAAHIGVLTKLGV